MRRTVRGSPTAWKRWLHPSGQFGFGSMKMLTYRLGPISRHYRSVAVAGSIREGRRRFRPDARRMDDAQLRLRFFLGDAERQVVLAGRDERGLARRLRLGRVDPLLLVPRQVPGDPVQPLLGGTGQLAHGLAARVGNRQLRPLGGTLLDPVVDSGEGGVLRTEAI